MTQTIELESIRRLDLQPGDSLVVTLPAGATAEYGRRVHDHFAAEFPDTKIVVMSHGMDVAVLCPSDPA